MSNTTYRVHKKVSGFSIIDNVGIDDERLSFRATGVLVWLLSKPDGWKIRSNVLASSKREGRDAVLTALKELEDCGYIRRTKYQDGPGGPWVWENHIYERPLDENDSPGPGFPDTGNRDTGNPTPGFPDTENQGLVVSTEAGRTEGTSTEVVSTENTLPIDLPPPSTPSGKSKTDYTPEFETAWKIYLNKKEKIGAFSRWKTTLKAGATVEELTAAVENYTRAKKREGTEVQFIKMMKTFLGPAEPWRDWVEVKRDWKDPRDNVETDRDDPGGLVDFRTLRTTREEWE